MTFARQFLDFPPDLTSKTINGRRFYNVNGKWFPSVTTVLGAQPKPHLDAWRQRVGNEEADRISSNATARGNALHSAVENYLLDKDPRPAPVAERLFADVRPILDKSVNNVFGIEAGIFSNTLAVAGRFDLGAEFDRRPAIIDFKTSTRPKRVEWMDGYFLQMSLYSFMVYEMFEKMVSHLVVIVAHEDGTPPAVVRRRAGEFLPRATEIVNDFYRIIVEESRAST